MKPKIELVQHDRHVWTNGLQAIGCSEIRAFVSESSLINEAEEFIQFVVDYILDNSVIIKPEETLVYGYWLTMFREASTSFLDAWEYDIGATKFEPGITRTLHYKRSQQQFCLSIGAEYEPPCADQLVVISEGVLEGEPLQAVRYPSPPHMSGWWLTTNRYNGDIKSLTQEHLYHVTALRPEVMRYVALPFGYRFYLDNKKEDVWFDKKVASRIVR